MFSKFFRSVKRVITGEMNPRIPELIQELEKRKSELDGLNEELELMSEDITNGRQRMAKIAEQMNNLEIETGETKESATKEALEQQLKVLGQALDQEKSLIDEFDEKNQVFDAKAQEFSRLSEELDNLV